MINAIKHQSIVGKDGRIEILSSQLPEGTKVEVIVLVESSEQDETEYLLSSAANRTQLLRAIEQSNDPDNRVVISSEEWHEKYRV
jgi:antitoxin YefM